MREVELKSVVETPDAVVATLLAAGAEPAFAGRLSDRRYDTPDQTLAARDQLLRVRTYANEGGARAFLELKGATGYSGQYKVREELGTGVADVDALTGMLGRLGYVVTREIDRGISQFVYRGATVRVERYPRMDVLVEIEGTPETIEAAIAATGLPRAGFTAERLADFVRRFESRTGARAAICERELAGDYRYGPPDA
jgi:adenylate cyclase class IV